MYNRSKIIEELNELDNYILGEGSSRIVFGKETFAIKYPLEVHETRYDAEEYGMLTSVLRFEDKINKDSIILDLVERENLEEIRKYLKKNDRTSFSCVFGNGINQSVSEYLTWISSTELEKKVLLPIEDFFFFNNLPIVVMKRVETIEDLMDDLMDELEDEAEVRNLTDTYQDFYLFLRRVFFEISEDYSMSNVCFSEGSLKILDYGMGINSDFKLY